MAWRMLIIEPDQAYSDFILKNSSDLDLIAVVAENFDEAVTFTEEEEIDFVLLDEMMPDNELIEAIQSFRSAKKPPDVFIIGEGIPDKVAQAARSGATAYLTREKFRADLNRQLERMKKKPDLSDQPYLSYIDLGRKFTDKYPKILVVDDSPILLRIINRMLQKSEYDVKTAGSGEECLEILASFLPDVILVDIVMPGIGGIELCRQLKENNDYKNIPILLMSTESELGRKIDGFNVGAADYLTKPFDEEELKARLMTHFLQKKLIEGLEEENIKRRSAESELRLYTNKLEEIVSERTKEIKASNELLRNEINERKQIQADLEKNRKRYRNIVESVNEWIWEIGEDGKFSYSSPKVFDVLGYDPDEVKGKAPGDFMDEEENTRFQGFIDENNSQPEKLRPFEHTCIGKDKSARIIESSMVPYYDEKERITGCRGVSRDITELKKNREEKSALQHQLLQAEKMASIGQLAAGVAHEINNPIGFVNSNLHSLEDYVNDLNELFGQFNNLQEKLTVAGAEGGLDDEIKTLAADVKALGEELDIEYILGDSREIISDCQEGINRVKNIIISLKDFAHPGEEKSAYADINSNLESTLVIVWNELKYKTTVVKEYGEIPEVYCNAQQLNQVFMNLLVNAAHAIEEKGTITIKTCMADEDHVEIRISDTGKGIQKENLTKIFDPFFTTKEVGKGTGLGLNLSYNIITSHGGTITVDSEVSQGTSFIIRLKTKKEEDEA